MAQRPVYQFKITLQEIEPAIWRRIQISDLCTFWDLHVAICDAMGWLDYHLHDFEILDPMTHEKQHMGIPDDDGFGNINILAGWEHKVRDYIVTNERMHYLYDFGDSWIHLVEHEGCHKKQLGRKYPVCLSGELNVLGLFASRPGLSI